MTPLYLAMPDVLHVVGLSDRRDTATLTLATSPPGLTIVRAGGSWEITTPAGTCGSAGRTGASM